MKVATRAPENRGNELEHNFGELAHSSKKPHKSKGIKRLYTGKNRLLFLESIAQRWFDRGLYRSPAIAMAALLGVDE
jgi:hypothetical protein